MAGELMIVDAEAKVVIVSFVCGSKKTNTS